MSGPQLARAASEAMTLATKLPPEQSDVADLIADASELAAEAAKAL